MPVPRHKTVQAVAGTLRRWTLIPDAATLVVALSGGPDSVALASILAELSRGTQRRWRLVLAHLNHGLRKTARRDETFVVDLARQWDLPLVAAGVNVRQLARRRGVGIEEAARAARYEFLESTAHQVGAELIAVGHHSDDQAETVLMNFLRGSGVRGLAGMPIRRPVATGSSVLLVRPLLEVRRDELIAYLKARGLTWMDDETNRSPKMLRNRLRHELMPMLERDYVPGLSRRLVQMADGVRAVHELLAGRAAAVWDGAVTAATARTVEFRLPVLRDEGRAVAGELILAALEWLDAGRGDITAEHLAAAWHVVTAPAGGQRLQWPGGVRLTRRGHRLRLTVGA